MSVPKGRKLLNNAAVITATNLIIFTFDCIVTKIKILRIINRFNIGGPTYNAAFLTRFLDDYYETMLVGGLPEEGESDSLYILDRYGIKPVLISEMKRKPSLMSDRLAYRKLKDIIKEFKPDIVHTHASKAGALGRKAAFSCGVPIVVHTFHGHVFHSYFGSIKTALYKRIERNLAQKSTGIIAISDRQKEELTHEHKIVNEEKIRVIPLGFELDVFQEKRINCRAEMRMELGLTDEVAIAIIGRLAPIKNHAFFFDALDSILGKLTKKVKIYIVGDGSEKESIEKRVELVNKQNEGLIVMTSWIKDIAQFNSAMDIVCLTSKNEGTPVSLIEAQAAGIPVISTDVGGVRDIVIDGDTGYVVPSDSPILFGQKMLELIENEKKLEIMSQNGWNHVREKFSYTTLVRNMDLYYKNLLSKKGK